MFTFDAIEKSLYNGISPDCVPDAIKNRFSMVFGCDALDNRLQVKISQRQIRFFYYDHDYGKDQDGKDKWNPNGVKDNDYFKEVGFITLTRAKDTGNDILEFPQNIGNLDLYKEVEYESKEEKRPNLGEQKNEGLMASMNKSISLWKTGFEEYPFFAEYNNIILRGEEKLKELKEKVDKENKNIQLEKNHLFYCTFRCFMQCCLLSFVYEFENRWQNFGASSKYDDVRDRLRESDVYKMLSAKIHYTQYLYKDHLSRSGEKYTYYTQKFADCLMDKRLNKVIPPDSYYGVEGKQGWFYNPEDELERILEKNRQQECEYGATLKDALVAKIRSFLYTKHSVYRAMTTRKSKLVFRFAQLMMLVFNVVMIVACINYKYDSWNGFFDHFFLFGIVWVGLVLIIVGVSGYLNGKSIISAVFPRIVVAEAAAWLTIGIAEDLIKSMLWTDDMWLVVAAIIAVLILVGILIFGEAKQHSPYLKRGENITKTLLVMNHSLFFALVLGSLMQVVFYHNLLKTSNVLSEVVYKEHFDKVDNYLQQLESLEKSINDYERFVQDYDMSNNSSISGDNSGNVRLKGELIGSKDTISLVLTNRLLFQSSFIKALGNSENICKYHNNLISAIEDDRNELKDTWGGKGAVWYNSIYCNMTVCWVNDSITKEEKEEVITENMEWIGTVIPQLKKEIQVVKRHQMDESNDHLLEWATVNVSLNESVNDPGVGKSHYLDSLIISNEKNKCCRKVGWFSSNNCNWRHFYPVLLLMHTLIVLVLAFITQLIISDKSVTEPL